MSNKITTDQLVDREVHYCVSSMVHTVARASTHPDDMGSDHDDFVSAIDQAVDLYQGPRDYESAARDEGWDFDDYSEQFYNLDEEATDITSDTWQDVCESSGIEPYYNDVLEHWIVSDWLADKLIAKGETVDKDFMGLTIWGRTTSGQGIAQDYVIQQIHEELVR